MKAIHWLLALALLTSITCLHSVSRVDFSLLFSIYTIAFITYFALVYKKDPISLRNGLIIALACRLAGFYSEPLLSDDYYRFIWDGYVMHSGLNPASIKPETLITTSTMPEIQQLYSLLNSPGYFSVYPPVLQFIFYSSYFINGLYLDGHIIFYKSILLCTDGLVILLLFKLLQQYKLPGQYVLIYALNPLVVLEYTGNLHMDSIMIAFLLASILLLEKKNIFMSSLMMTLSISTKMLSLILMPFMPLRKSLKEFLSFQILTVALSIAFFMIFFRSHSGWMESIGLWFRQFEFNSSFYYLAQFVYASMKGYEEIKFIGPLMAGISIVIMFLIWLWSIRKKIHWSVAMTLCLYVYFLCSTTVHPWYLGILLVVSVISGYIFPMVWTYVAFLSYSHYEGGGFSENYPLIATEYLVVLLFGIYELSRRKEKAPDVVIKGF